MSRWKTWVGILVSALAIWWAMRGVEWALVWPALRAADWTLLAVVFLLAPVVNVGVRAIRWRILLGPVARLSVSSCASATAVGLLANNVLPARIGEFVRAYALARREPVATATAFGSLFLERMFDGFALVGILYALRWVVDLPSWANTTAVVAFWIFVGFAAFQAMLVAWPRKVIGAAQWVRRRIFGGRFEEAIEGALATFVEGFQLLKRPGLVAISAALGLAQWVLVALLFFIGMAAFGLARQAGFEGALFTNSITALGVAAPSSPGFVGTFQAFVVQSLEAFDVDRTIAFTYSLGFHAVNYVSVTLVGLICFLREGLSWKELEQSEEELERELIEDFDTQIEPQLEGNERD
ncbi:MAG TPA: lysylphosphatidylglycerol synthase transmembrane domain-containing protein [Gemmatimonadota bacterium]|nr:lysylphosphatidylglycerol synthase transmembrane domain-containing protein [Gemmatimonadota bacterium]